MPLNQMNPVPNRPESINPLEKIEQLLTCAICLDRYRNPKLLPCQHTFCMEPCLEGLVDIVRRTMKCPECRAEHPLPFDGVKAFQTNYTLMGFLEIHLQASNENAEELEAYIRRFNMERCKLCNEKAEVEYCPHCDKRVCLECKTSHREMLKRDLNRLMAQVKRIYIRISEAATSLTKGVDSMETNIESVKEEIQDYVKRFVKELYKRQDILLTELETFAHAEMRLMRTQRDNLNLETKNIDEACTRIESCIKGDTEVPDEELVRYKQMFTEGLDYLRLFNPDSEDFAIKKIRFQVSDPQILPPAIAQFGELHVCTTHFNKYQAAADSFMPRFNTMSLESDNYKRRSWDPNDSSTWTRKEEERESGGKSRSNRRQELEVDIGLRYGRSGGARQDGREKGAHHRSKKPGKGGAMFENSPWARVNNINELSPNSAIQDDYDDETASRSSLSPLPRSLNSRGGAGSSGGNRRDMADPEDEELNQRINKIRREYEARQLRPPEPIIDLSARSRAGSAAASPSRRSPNPATSQLEVPVMGSNSSSLTDLPATSGNVGGKRTATSSVNDIPIAASTSPSQTTESSEESSSEQEEEESSPPVVAKSKSSKNGGLHDAQPIPIVHYTPVPASKPPISELSSSTSSQESTDQPAPSRSKLPLATLTARSPRSSPPAESSNGGVPDWRKYLIPTTDPLVTMPNESSSSRKKEDLTLSDKRGRFVRSRTNPDFYSTSQDRSESPDERTGASGAYNAGCTYRSKYSTESKSREGTPPASAIISSRRFNRSGSSSNLTAEAAEEIRKTYASPAATTIVSGGGSSSRTSAESRRPNRYRRKTERSHSAYVDPEEALNESASPVRRERERIDSNFRSAEGSGSRMIRVFGATPKINYLDKGRSIVSFGSKGSRDGQFNWPRGVAVAMGNEIVVCDSSNHRMQIFDHRGQFQRSFGAYGTARGEFDCLAGVCVNKYRQFVITDRYNHRVQVFDSGGVCIREFGAHGQTNGKFSSPWGVVVDAQGFIYVCDKDNHRVQIFQADGNFVGKFGGIGNMEGQFQNPHFIAVNKFNQIFVSDSSNHRVQVFDHNGHFQFTFGSEGFHEGQFKYPRGIAIDEQGFVVVADSGNNRIQIFNPDGRFHSVFGGWGSGEGQFKQVEGVAILKDGRIVVADRENHRIQIF